MSLFFNFKWVMVDVAEYSKCNYITVSLVSVDFIGIRAESKEPNYVY